MHPASTALKNALSPMVRAIPLVTLALLTTACPGSNTQGPADSASTTDVETATHGESMHDVHSHARPDEAAIDHLHLDLTVDFAAKQLVGRATLTLENHGANELRLDTRDLDIRGVTLGSGEATDFQLTDPQPWLGSGLNIAITPDTETVHVDYASSPGAAAVQWLEPSMTAGGEHPFLFTQSQAILARTWVPCQDTPGVRFTYSAQVKVPEGLMAVMSAENATETAADGVYTFDMPQRIPSYLLALAVGDLAFESIGEQVGVFAEPSVLEKAAWEFADTQEMMDSVAELYGPYQWGRYDILVLPPAFPFGGMENPRLTFATPTILAGDRSLVALIAHELAHSWSGNLVTNATWNDFWLNEGFTVYLERRIMEALEGKDYADMLALLGRQDLEASVASLEAADTHLFLDLEGRDPDDGMTDIAYEKGYFFLRAIEEEVGRERFDAFLRAHFDRHAFESLTTETFVGELRNELIGDDAELAERLQIDAWIYGPGLPSNTPDITSAAFEHVDAQIDAWQGGTAAADLGTEGWNTHQWLRFLRGLPSGLSGDQMVDLDGAFGFTQTGNSEVLHAWLHHVIANGYEPGYGALEDFLTGMGRRKFLQPLYQRMANTEGHLERAKTIYAEARPGYHSVSTNTIDAILDWQG